jgi:uncharacterized protein YukJ
MLIKDFVRELTKIKKKNPEAPVYIFGDKGDLEVVENIVVCYAPQDLVQNNTVMADHCVKEMQDNYLPVIVVG